MNSGGDLGECVVAYLKVLSWHFPGESEENYKKYIRIPVNLAEIRT